MRSALVEKASLLSPIGYLGPLLCVRRVCCKAVQRLRQLAFARLLRAYVHGKPC